MADLKVEVVAAEKAFVWNSGTGPAQAPVSFWYPDFYEDFLKIFVI